MFLYAAYSSAEEYSLAHSKKLGVEVFATGDENGWCSKKPQLSLIADKKDFYKNGKAGALLGKIGKAVIEKKCPQASSLSIVGSIKGGATKQLSGSAKKADGWKLIKQVVSKKKDSLLTDKPLTEKLLSKLDTGTKSKKKPSNLFSVGGWQPKPESGLSVLPPAKFLELFNADKTCKIRLDPTYYVGVDGYYEQNQESKGVCVNGYLEGYSRVTLYSTKDGGKRSHSIANAHYVDGIPFSGDFNKPLLELFQVANISTYNKTIPFITFLSYYLGSDKKNKIHYIGTLVAHTRNPTLDACSMRIVVVSENEELFENHEAIPIWTNKAIEYGRQICPDKNIRQAYVTATANRHSFYPKADDTIYADLIFDFNRRKDRFESQRGSRYYSVERKRARVRKANAAYPKIAAATLKKRIAFLHGVERIDNSLRQFLTKLGVQEEMSSNFFARVSEVDGDSAETDWPTEMKLTNVIDQIEEPGWYIFTGDVEIENEDERNSYGYPKGIVDITKVTACKQEACGEAKDAIQLIRTKFKLPDWEPRTSQGRKR